MEELYIDSRKWAVNEVIRQMTNDFKGFLNLHERWYVAYLFSDYVKDEIERNGVEPAALPVLPSGPGVRTG